VHARALAIGIHPDARRSILAANIRCEELSGPKDRVKVQRLRDPERQIPELVKFHSYFWPRSRNGALPLLRPDLLQQLTHWLTDETFESFTFELNRSGEIDFNRT
jgi:hypothetical protein